MADSSSGVDMTAGHRLQAATALAIVPSSRSSDMPTRKPSTHRDAVPACTRQRPPEQSFSQRIRSFCPLLADPKEARSFVSFLRGTFRSLDDPTGEGTSIASVGLGDSFGLVRWGGPDAGEGIQLDIVGSIFAQFDIGAPSNDLINADYVIGLPLTFRRNGFSVRAELYHQSSHLGDEYLLRGDDIVRENLSFESVDFSFRKKSVRCADTWAASASSGASPTLCPIRFFRRASSCAAVGRGKCKWWRGVDVKTTELHEWSPALSARVGLEIGRPGPEGHPGRLDHAAGGVL